VGNKFIGRGEYKMKKTTLSLGLISALSLTILGGMTAFAYDDAGSVQRPPAAQKAEKPGQPPKGPAPAPREAGSHEKPPAGKSEAINKAAAELGISTTGLEQEAVVKAIEDKNPDKLQELGLTPPPRRGGPSPEERQELALKAAADLGITTDGKKVEDLEKEIHQKQLESKADLLKSAAVETGISTDGRSLEEIQDLLKAYYYAKLEAIGIAHEERKPAPRPEGAAANPTSDNPSTDTTNSSNSENAATSVVISGGFDTDPQDHGRPVVLIAAALGVPTEVFREAFSGVTPAGTDSGGPSSEQAQQNKKALLSVLAPYGITNDRLDEVSNYYRYNGSKGQIWSRTLATATATVTNGVVTGVTITNPGSGYSSNPTVTVTGPNGKVTATAALSYTTDFKTNGSVTAITIK
jgi:hypothetical protein